MAISGTAYASLEDFAGCGLPPGALASLDKTVILNELIRQSRWADTYLGDKYTLPLSAPFDSALSDAVCQLAAWRLLTLRGFNPSNPGDTVVRQNWMDAKEWLTRIANGQARLQVSQAQPPSLQPDVVTNQQRGYGQIAAVGIVSRAVPGTGNWGT